MEKCLTFTVAKSKWCRTLLFNRVAIVMVKLGRNSPLEGRENISD